MKEATVFEHLADFQKTLLKMGLAVFFCSLMAFVCRVELAELVQGPLADQVGASRGLQVLGVSESIDISIKLSLFFGTVFAIPLVLLLGWGFLGPALKDRERVPAVVTGIGACVMFAAGVLFGFFVLAPVVLTISAGEAVRLGWRPEWTVGSYYSLVFYLCLWCGVAFQVPVGILGLTSCGILRPEALKKSRPFVISLIFIGAAIATPTGDVATLFLAAAPIVVLFELSVLGGALVSRRDGGK
jgi:sec-independent protein translocase protein TatC